MKLLKKLSLLTALLFVTSNLLMAQLSLGVRGGINLAKEYVEFSGESETSDALTGLTLAGLIEIGMGEHFAIQPELVFVQKGGSNGDSDDDLTLNHFDVPVLLKYKVGAESFGGYLAAGPTFGYALSGKFGDEKFEDDDWEGYNRFELGASLGGGLGLNLASGMVFLDIRYLLSLNNLSEDDEITIKNRGIGLSVGYLHTLGD